ncbi:hypothetical protein KSP40_PGU019319 [Platanthera guangdongensis]|uniref:Uncharacterized protein n=1 Tax=Platanthera guangdongensis TaxID=2320717 RepID=A0ABR2LZF6_9ASPA
MPTHLQPRLHCQFLRPKPSPHYIVDMQIMLKFPELMFTDVEPQVQIASLVTWEHLVDAFLPPEINEVPEVANEEKISDCSIISERVDDELLKDLLRRIKVLMVPLQGIISSKCDISVHMACLNTWHYLLHKLDHLVNHPLVLLTTFRPFLEVIFWSSPDNENFCLWKPCLNLFEQYISGTVKSKEMDLVSTSCACDVANEKGIPISCISSGSRMHYCIKWLPCKVCDIDFPLMVIKAIVSHGQVKPIDPEIRTFSQFCP